MLYALFDVLKHTFQFVGETREAQTATGPCPMSTELIKRVSGVDFSGWPDAFDLTWGGQQLRDRQGMMVPRWKTLGPSAAQKDVEKLQREHEAHLLLRPRGGPPPPPTHWVPVRPPPVTGASASMSMFDMPSTSGTTMVFGAPSVSTPPTSLPTVTRRLSLDSPEVRIASAELPALPTGHVFARTSSTASPRTSMLELVRAGIAELEAAQAAAGGDRLNEPGAARVEEAAPRDDGPTKPSKPRTPRKTVPPKHVLRDSRSANPRQ